jgi:hypothetical protein
MATGGKALPESLCKSKPAHNRTAAIDQTSYGLKRRGKMSAPKHLMLPSVFVIAIVIFCYFFLDLIPTIIFLIAFGGGLILYVRTAWRTQFDGRKARCTLPAYNLIFHDPYLRRVATGVEDGLASFMIPATTFHKK